MRSLALLTTMSACGAVSIQVAEPASTLDAAVAAPFSLPSTQGDVALADVLARGPAVLVFYRGHW